MQIRGDGDRGVIRVSTMLQSNVKSGDLVGELASQLSTAKHTDKVMSAERMI